MVHEAFARLIKEGSAIVFAGAGLTRVARCRKSRSRLDMNVRAPLNQPEECKGASKLSFSVDERHERFQSRGRDLIPLIKASSAITSKSASARATSRSSIDTRLVSNMNAGVDLSGRCILCVDGRAALYPEYRRAVETSGGNLLIYRSRQQREAERQSLPALLAEADMVICPVDCVSHHAFFTVKRYCKYHGKPCVLLDRSGLPTFRKGVAALAALTVSAARA